MWNLVISFAVAEPKYLTNPHQRRIFLGSHFQKIQSMVWDSKLGITAEEHSGAKRYFHTG